MQDVPNFKCILVGDAHTGKSKFFRRLASECDNVEAQEYINVLHVIFKTEFGFIKLEIHDTVGQEINGILEDSFFWNANCAILFFDVTATESFQNVSYWHRRTVSLCGKIPIVLCGNRADLRGRKVSNGLVRREWNKRLPYYEISSGLNVEGNISEVFNYLSEKLIRKGKIAEFNKIGFDYHLDIDSLHKLLDQAVEANAAVKF